jgi:hypothetical protein
MLKRVVSALTLCFMSLPAWAQTEAAAAASEAVDQAPQTVLVSGSRPGPGLWKISKDDHVMWVFGSYDPLPTKMEWRSRDIEKAIAASEQYLKPPASGVGIGVMGGIGVLPFLFGITKNPDGATLKDVLPPDLYARWRPLKEVYFAGDDSIERERPMFVASQLASRARKAAGLDGGREIGKKIDTLVAKHGLKVVDATYTITIKDPGKTAREFKKSSVNDAACLAKTIERLETELIQMRARANAWAVGEPGAIRKLNYGERDACFEGVSTSSLAKNQPELLTLKEKGASSWISAAEKALATNTSTFAVVHIKDILDPKGVIATLQAKGYTVEPPK